MHEIEICIVVDETGDYGMGQDAENALDNYRETVGEVNGPIRIVGVKLSVPVPTAPLLTGIVPHEGGATLTLA